MVPIAPGDSDREKAITPTITLRPSAQWQGRASVVEASPAVLGDEGSAPAALMSLFAPEGPAIELQIQPAPAAVLGDEAEQQGALDFQPDEEAAFVLVQTIETDAGQVIYDFTLPVAVADGGAMVLGETAQRLRFPINPVALGSPPASEPSNPAVLGIEDVVVNAVGGAIGDAIRKRVVQVFKAQIDRAVVTTVERFEGEPQMLALRDASKPEELFQPLDGAEAWRALLPAGAERRVLLYVHGFASSAAASSAGTWLPALAPGYDAVLCYNHPTLARDPLRNGLDLLALIPEDLRLSVDIIAHSRGGLVARSLVELVDPSDRFVPRALVTCGTPHAGTELANPVRWDRLISLTMTAVSWLAVAGGFATPIPKILEWVLKSAAQGFFALPGVAAMVPGDPTFLAQLNAAATAGSAVAALQERVRYGAVSSRFSIFNVKPITFQEAFGAIVTQAFIGHPNDMVVTTDSMSALDSGVSLAADQRHLAAVNHWEYFRDDSVVEFIRHTFAT